MRSSSSVRAAEQDGEGEHFCAGLDLSELKERDAGEGVYVVAQGQLSDNARAFARDHQIAVLQGDGMALWLLDRG